MSEDTSYTHVAHRQNIGKTTVQEDIYKQTFKHNIKKKSSQAQCKYNKLYVMTKWNLSLVCKAMSPSQKYIDNLKEKRKDSHTPSNWK